MRLVVYVLTKPKPNTMKRFFTKLSFLLTVGAALLSTTGWGQTTCGTAVPLACGSAHVTGNTVGVANDNAGSGAGTCAGVTVIANGQYWYSITAPSNGNITLSTDYAGTDYDTRINVYTGSCGALTCVAADDDGGVTFVNGWTSVVNFNITAGTTYLVRVGAYSLADEGSFEMSIECQLASDGCTDNTACNYSAEATNDDGSCCYDNCLTINMFDAFGNGWNGNVATISTIDGTVVGTATLLNGFEGSQTFCLPNGCYTISVDGGFGQADVSWELLGAQGGTVIGGAPTFDLVFGIGQSCNPGCDDINATNYDPNATVNDGSCVYCGPSESLLIFNMEDQFDGWNGAEYFITDQSGSSLFAQGSLDNALIGPGELFGTDYICLIPGCYEVTVTPGTWEEEISWSITDQAGNVIASADAPNGATTIGFTWGGAVCDIQGCTNPDCLNFNPSATTDDGSCLCPAANDDCANAEPIGCGSVVTGTVANASADPNAGTCGGVAVTTAGVWYYFQGTGEQITLSTCAAAWDTKMHLYTGTCDGLICVAANDDQAGCNLASQIVFNSEVGLDYYVLISRYSAFTAQTDFTLEMTCTSCPSTPVNDNCVDALPLPDGVTVNGSLCCTGPEPISAFQNGYGVWYTMNSGDFDTFDFTLTNGDAAGADANDGTNVGLRIYTAGPNGCIDQVNTNIGCQVADVCAGSLYGILDLIPNTDYYFLVYTTDVEACGNYTFIADLTYVGCTDASADNYNPDATIEDGSCTYTNAPANDLCAGAIALTCNSTVTGTTGGSTATGAPTSCNLSNGDNGVWYTLAGDGQFHTLSSCGSAIDSRIEVFSSANGCAGPYNCIVSEDNDASDAGCGFFDGDDASVDFIAEVGITYYIYISAVPFDANNDGVDDVLDGSFTLDFSCSPVVEGCLDACACNYNANANVDNGDCDYFSCVDCTAGNPVMMDMEDDFGDGWNGGTYEIADALGNVVATGSIDDAQCSADNDNNVGADTGFDVFCLEDGCYTITVGGGAWDGEITWNLVDANGNTLVGGTAPNGDGTFSLTLGSAVCGCTDPNACNFDNTATSEDGSCEYTSCAGCTDNTACNFDPNAIVSAPEQCCYGECLTFNMTDSANDGWNGGVATFVNASTGIIAATASLPTGGSGSIQLCLEPGCYNLVVGGGTWDGEIGWTAIGANGGIISGNANIPNGINFSIGDGANCTPGCTEPLACNYDPNAGLSDCSLCEYTTCLGCTYDTATNYDPNASIDDGSCIIEAASTCPSDINGDGLVGIQDLIIFINDFGLICPN